MVMQVHSHVRPSNCSANDSAHTKSASFRIFSDAKILADSPLGCSPTHDLFGSFPHLALFTIALFVNRGLYSFESHFGFDPLYISTWIKAFCVLALLARLLIIGNWSFDCWILLNAPTSFLFGSKHRPTTHLLLFQALCLYLFWSNIHLFLTTSTSELLWIIIMMIFLHSIFPDRRSSNVWIHFENTSDQGVRQFLVFSFTKVSWTFYSWLFWWMLTMRRA